MYKVYFCLIFLSQTAYGAADARQFDAERIVGVFAPQDRMLITHTTCRSKKLTHLILSTTDTRLTTATLERFLATTVHKSCTLSATDMAQELYKGLESMKIKPTTCAIAQIILTAKSCTMRHYSGHPTHKTTLKTVEQTLADTTHVSYIQTSDGSTFLLKQEPLTLAAQQMAAERHDPDSPLSLIIDIQQWRTYCQTQPKKKCWWQKIVN